jgi:hypothetical protein
MIYVNGDSFTSRSSIQEDYSWSSHLSRKTNQTIVNQAAGCGSNSRMLSNLHDLYSLGVNPELVIIALSSHVRWHVPSSRFSSWSIGPTIINDRSGIVDESALKWWVASVFDKLEFVRQYYNQIWQMHEFCRNYLKCPIIFFNAFDNNIVNIEKQLFYSEASQRRWVVNNSLEPLDTYTEQYVKVFNFYKEASKSWVRFTTPWTSFLNPNYIDPPNGEHPNHPSREGHVLISDYVLCKIQETFPTIYQQWKIS